MMIKSVVSLMIIALCATSLIAQVPSTNTLPTIQRQQMIQQLIDLPELQQFYHAELPERQPLKLLAGPMVTPNLVLRKFNQPVLILSQQQLARRGIRDYLNITQLRVRQDTVDFRFGYNIEGVVGAGKLVKHPQGWVVYKYYVAEN